MKTFIGVDPAICQHEPFRHQLKDGIRCQKEIGHEESHHHETKDTEYWWEDEGGVAATLKETYKLYKIKDA